MKVAAIDCGTNTIKLLIADLHRGNQVELVREIRMVRLGEGVDATGRLSEAALARAFAAIDEYAQMIAEHAVTAVRMCATSAVRDAATADIAAALDQTLVPLGQTNAVIGVAGSITTTAAMVLGLAHYDRQLLNNAVIDTDKVHLATHVLLAMTVEERRALGFMHPGRADVIGAGALILDQVLRRTPVSTMLVSESDILDGIAWSLVG